MAFNDLSFVFLFFPAVLLIHWAVPAVLKNTVLLIFSLIFFAWGSPTYVLLMILLIVFNYFSGMQIAAQKQEGNEKYAKFALISAVVADLLLLGFFKYWGFLLDNINGLLGTSLAAPQAPMPLGVSFFTFSLLSYLYDVYRDKAPAVENIIDFSLFVTFFPKLVSGPIVQYSAFQKQLKDRTCNALKFGKGCRMFLVGLAKKVLLSNMIGTTFYAVTALPMDQVSLVTAWLGAVSYALMLYFDFSGYSDMAIGLAAMFGFHFDANFNYPYMSKSISEFWRRWHISLGTFFREYVYIPMGGNRVSRPRQLFNLFVVWGLTGLWHGAEMNFVVWGLYYFALIALERFVLRRFLDRLPSLLRIVGTYVLVLVGWVIFYFVDFAQLTLYLRSLIGLGQSGLLPLYTSELWIVINQYSWFPLLAMAAALPISA